MDAKKKFIIDMGVLIIYLIAANPSFTGVSLHEWIGLGVLVIFIVHTAVSADRLVTIIRTLKSERKQGKVFGIGHCFLDAVIVIALMVCAVSGLMISGAVLQTFGLYADGYYFWNPLHAVSAKVLLALLVVHVATHWKWIAGFLKKGEKVK